jgi:uncharacterized membrane protein
MKKPPARRPTPIAEQEREVEEQRRVSVAEWSGPLPPPAILNQFNNVVENGAERIFAAWERETAHRHKLESRDLFSTTFDVIMGKVFAFLFVLAALLVCVFAIFAGAEWVAAVLGGGVITSVVWAFVKVNRPKS